MIGVTHFTGPGCPWAYSAWPAHATLLFLHVVRQKNSSFALVALIMFAVVAAWGGAVGYLRERNVEPSFDLTAMLRKPEASTNGNTRPREPVSGYLIARTGDALLIATESEAFTTEAWRIVVIPRDHVEEMAIGPSCVLTAKNLGLAAALADELESEHDPTRSRTAFSAKDLAQCSSGQAE